MNNNNEAEIKTKINSNRIVERESLRSKVESKLKMNNNLNKDYFSINITRLDLKVEEENTLLKSKKYKFNS